MSASGRRLAGACIAAAAAAMLWTGAPARSAAAEQAETIARVKASVVVVGTFQATRNPRFRFRGTGFAVGDGTLVATNAHVVPVVDSEKFETLTVLVRREDGRIAQFPATQVADDPDHDVALLRFKGPPLAPLQLGDSARVREGEFYLFTGFPIGEVLGAFPVTHRAMISAVAPVAIPSVRASRLDPQLVRRLKGEPFEIFQLDGTAYPGNSGSPLYDAGTGAVVGVLNMVFVKRTKEAALEDPSGISYAIPARHVAELLRGVR